MRINKRINQDAIALMRDKKVRSLIVEPGEDGAYGIVTETDIVYKVATKDVAPESIMVYQIMTKPCIVVNPDLDLKNVARLFAETGIARAPVIQKELLGMISTTDLIMNSRGTPPIQRRCLRVSGDTGQAFPSFESETGCAPHHGIREQERIPSPVSLRSYDERGQKHCWNLPPNCQRKLIKIFYTVA